MSNLSSWFFFCWNPLVPPLKHSTFLNEFFSPSASQIWIDRQNKKKIFPTKYFLSNRVKKQTTKEFSFYCLELTLSQVYYNTIHSATSDQRKCSLSVETKSFEPFVFVSASYAPLTSLFSTRVISGATSTPDFNQLVQRKHAGRKEKLSSRSIHRFSLFFSSFHRNRCFSAARNS